MRRFQGLSPDASIPSGKSQLRKARSKRKRHPSATRRTTTAPADRCPLNCLVVSAIPETKRGAQARFSFARPLCIVTQLLTTLVPARNNLAMGASEEFLNINGSQGEGGGQILRTCLALSLCLGRPFSIHHIRRHRPRPGLMPQHLIAVRAAASVSGAQVEGAEPGSQTLRFEPGPIRPGEYHFSIGTAGSTTLVLQTLLPALLAASAPTRLVLDGGTHNPLAPSFHFVSGAFLPVLCKMGARAALRLMRPGFYPVGGGRLEADIEPCKRLAPLHLEKRGPVQAIHVLALLSRLPRHIAERELHVIGQTLRVPEENRRIEEVAEPRGPGNALVVTVKSENIAGSSPVSVNAAYPRSKSRARWPPPCGATSMHGCRWVNTSRTSSCSPLASPAVEACVRCGHPVTPPPAWRLSVSSCRSPSPASNRETMTGALP